MSARRKALLALACSIVPFAASCGEDDGGVEGPASLVPAGSPVYVEATVDPGSQEVADLGAMIERLGSLPVIGSPVDGTELVERALDAVSADSGIEVSYEEDIAPWLGERVALGVGSLDRAVDDGVFVAETRDEELARTSLEDLITESETPETREYEGHEYLVSPGEETAAGIVDGFVVVAGDGYFETVVDAARGDSLGDSSRFSDAFSGLDEEGLGRLYVDLGEVPAEELVGDGESVAGVEAARGLVPELLSEPLAAVASVETDALLVDVALRSDAVTSPAQSDMLGDAPSDSIIAVGIDDPASLVDELVARLEAVGPAAGQPALTEGSIAAAFEARFGLSLDEALAEFGDGVAFARGSLDDGLVAGLDLSLVKGAGDPSTSAPLQLLTQLGDLLEAEGYEVGPPVDEGGTGFSAVYSTRDSGPLTVIDAEIEDDRVSLSYSFVAEPAGPEPGGSLDDEDLFADAIAALGDDYEPLAVADAAAILDGVIQDASLTDVVTGSASPEAAVLQFLAERLEFAVAGLRAEEGRLFARLQVGVE